MDIDSHHHRVNEALRAYGATYAQLAREFAAREGLHSTDAIALIEILAADERGAPLSPARLSDRIGLTFGATSTLLNRLETAGHITRHRVNTDRRLVTLHSTPSIQAIAESFFEPLGERISAAMSRHPPQFLDEFSALLDQLRAVMETYMVNDNRDDGRPHST